MVLAVPAVNVVAPFDVSVVNSPADLVLLPIVPVKSLALTLPPTPRPPVITSVPVAVVVDAMLSVINIPAVALVPEVVEIMVNVPLVPTPPCSVGNCPIVEPNAAVLGTNVNALLLLAAVSCPDVLDP